MGDCLALFKDLGKYNFTDTVPARSHRGKAGREGRQMFCQIAVD